MKSTFKSKLYISSLFALVAVLTTLGLTQVFAATGSMYVRSSASSLKKGQTVSVSVRINPGTTVDSVQGTVNFDSSKLKLNSVSTSGSAFTTELSNTSSASSFGFARGDFGSGVKSDALIVSASFTALVGSGSTSLSISGGNAANGGNFTNPGVSGTSISFYTPVAPTPTPKPTPEPTPAPSSPKPSNGSGSTDGSSGSSSSNKNNSGSSSSGSGSDNRDSDKKPVNNSPVADKPAAATQPNANPSNVKLETTYNTATVALSTKEPTVAYLMYGLGDELTQQTKTSKLSKKHELSLDPNMLVPGEEYSYVIVTKTKSGKEVATEKRTIQVKGLTVMVRITDKDGDLIKNTNITLRSKPQTAKTDENGIVTFTNVVPGNHRVVYASDKEYSQPISVANNVVVADGIATSATQNFSVSYAVKPFNAGMIIGWGIVLVVIVLLIVAILFIRRNGPGAIPLVGSMFSPKPSSFAQGPTTGSSGSDQSPTTDQQSNQAYYHNDTVQAQWLKQNRSDDDWR